MKPIEENPPQPPVAKPGEPQVASKKEAEQKKPEAKPLNKIFYGVNKENNIDILSFITGNSLQAYWSKQTGKAKPRIVRVVYRLVPDKESKNSFNLSRTEGNDLKFESYKPGGTKEIKEFIMIEGIKSLSMQYVKEKKDEKDKDGSALAQADVKDKKKKKEFSTVKEWKVDTQNEDKAKKEAQDKQLIPNAILIKGEVWDKDKRRAHPFEFKFELNPAATSLEEAKQGQAPKKPPIDAWGMIGERFPPHLAKLFEGQMPSTAQPQTNVVQQNSTASMVHKQQESVVIQPPIEHSYVTTEHVQKYLAQG